MFTIEHDFECTEVVILDEADPKQSFLNDDVQVLFFEDSVQLIQEREHGDSQISMSLQQFNDLIAAFHLPEGAYRTK